MDTITQAALGAAIGQAGWRGLGRRALGFGALCGLLPDLDVVLGRGFEGIVSHRGMSHSLVVLPVVALPVGWLGWRLLGRGRGAEGADRGTPWQWIALAFWGLVTHPLLDTCTTYGTQLLAPLSRARFSWDAVAIIDPIYTVPLLAAVAVGLRRNVAVDRAAALGRAAVGFGVLYLAAGFGWSQWAKAEARTLLADQGFTPVALRTPAPMMFPPLRRIAARDADGRLMVGTIAPWAPERTTLTLLVSDEDPAVDAVLQTWEGGVLSWFSDGYLFIEVEDDGGQRIVSLRDQRYGMYSDPTWTPFRARAVVDAAGRVVEVRMAERGGGGGTNGQIDPGAEWAAGWRLLTGR